MIDSIFCCDCSRQEGQTHDCKYCKMTDAGGCGEKIAFTPFDGITMSYNDFFIEAGEITPRDERRIISIDHCDKGRVQWLHDDGSVCYLGEGDIQISVSNDHARCFGFPPCMYHGISISILVDTAADSLKRCFPAFSVDMETLWTRFGEKQDFFISASEHRLRRAFQDLYTSKLNMTNDYLRLKIMEILIALHSLENAEISEEKPYFRSSHIYLVRRAKEYLCENSGKKVTVRELSEKFDIPQSTLKMCFKSIYGISISEFMKAYRLHHAAMLLQSSELSIIEIVLQSGYENPSKFSAAFKKTFSQTPLKYRKDNSKTEHF